MKKRWNLFDFFLLVLLILAGLSVYLTLVKPIPFSNLIKREGVSHYAEVEILLPDDLNWLRHVVPVGEESMNVYGMLDWKILGFGERRFGDKRVATVKAKLSIVEYSSGILHYGKYTLVKGSRIYLINDHYFIEGRVYDVRVLPEKVLM